MLTVRKNTFETNSSSTHCLCFSKQHETNADETILNSAMIIEPFTDTEVDYEMTLTTLKDKLRYFLTVYEQADFTGNCFMQMLQRLCPNVVFRHTFSNSKYLLEDAEYFFHYDECESDEFTESILKEFLLYGTVYFGSRDDEDYMDKIDSITSNNDTFSVKWSG